MNIFYNILIITTSLFNLIAHTCPQAFRHLRYLLIGDEALNPHFLRRVLHSSPSQHLINCYGSTESTIMSLNHEITLDELTEESVPIGKPIANTDIYILDENQQTVEPNKIGERYIGGEGLARGY
ncbi:AMP-binding protein [Xenorhabdus koppenhoeferi]|uniref:AMP-binding protein n=1 Tax=Xenorhabdus koppenhoeferi TaxID=351659 RepID=UPI002B403D81|nr:AMP-binding protein [Xenorhabdus sp. Vera]